MNFAVPRNEPAEMVLYIWKIIDIPQISLDSLLFKLSFELLLFNPTEAEKFVGNALKAKYIIKESDNLIKLSDSLEKRLKAWQQKQKSNLIEKVRKLQKQDEIRTEFLEENKDHFNVLLKGLIDRGTINRAATVSDNAFNIELFTPKEHKILAEVKGSKEVPYHINIDIDKKILSHNCHDFETNRAQNYKFCKHLTKLFLILRKKDEAWTNEILDSITNYLEEWKFTA